MFDTVTKFEELIADYFNSPYAVAVDCCTHAIELCLRLHSVKQLTIPKHTYLSIPMTAEKLNIQWSWVEDNWHDCYQLSNPDATIFDAAVLWHENSYVNGSMMCLSFQFKKHLNLGRGGIILLDDKHAYHELIRMSYDGRDRNIAWAEQDVKTIGYHYYMTPETAELGMLRFETVKNVPPTRWSYSDYPDLSTLKVFEHVK